ncbi:MAG: hypothetical protein H6661_04120 [Ardenticatenaceae bacterium]|nr:hypothetical protein [Ardenticatenaceae bacterium]
MTRINLALLALALWLLAACAPTYTPPGSMPEAAARLDAAQAEYARIAAQSTQQAAQATAVYQAQVDAANAAATGTAVAATQTWQATADSLAVQQTQEAMAAQSTREAIGSHATETAVAQVAIVEAQLVADEATRIATQREAERVQVEYQRRMNALKPWLWGGLVAAVLVFVAGIVYRLHRISQPVRNGNGDVIALPNNAFQVMPSRLLPQHDEPLLLPPPQPTIELPQITRGHVLIAATTGSGKTICLRELVDMRGGSVVVLDPHYTPGAWGIAQVISGNGMGDYLDQLTSELETRIQARHGGQRQFDPLTVATEEMPALVNHFGRDILRVWMRVMREGRKFNIFMMVVSQSTRVKSLGIDGEGDLLDNFDHVIELGKNAAEAHPELTAGMRRPAVIRSGHHPPRPVVIPYDPRKDSESDKFIPFYPFNQGGPQIAGGIVEPPINNLPPGPRPLDTRWGIITSQEIATIISMYRNGASQSAIEQTVFGYKGGSAYHKVNAVLEGATNATGGPFPGR